VIIYAIAAGKSTFTDPKGMQALRNLYITLGVPLDGMTIALKELEQRTLTRTSAPSEEMLVRACFDHLLQSLNPSGVKS
jgi:hypothetical protein